jgi:thioredoxin-like negative regulator of GroEL
VKNKSFHKLAAICLLEALCLGLLGAPACAADDSPSIQALLAQADYWHKKFNDQLASESLGKVLMVDANNAQALYLMALWAKQRGDTQEAEQWQARLEKAHPSSTQLQELKNNDALNVLPKNQLALARQQASAGNIKEALASWEKLFEGSEPPLALAPEYYVTMAGDKNLYQKAADKLQSLVKQNPDNVALKVTYAKVLTYRETTRRSGMTLLESMAETQPEADTSLRQTLLWLEPTSADKRHYTRWMQRHPKDNSVLNHYERRIGGDINRSGYTELDRGNLEAAQQAFQLVLKSSPNDGDALAGMGYVSLNNGDYAAAATYLSRAAARGGSKAQKRKAEAQEAAFYADLAQAKQAHDQGDLAKALELSAPLAAQTGEQGSAAKLFRADLLRQNGDYAQSEALLATVLKGNANHELATEQLYNVLIEQNKEAQANQLLSSVPKAVQLKILSADTYGNIRRKADEALDAGNIQTAIFVLEDGVDRLPNNPWLRLELARLLNRVGNELDAANIIAYLYRPQASNDDLYVAALFAGDNHNWKRVENVLSRILPNERDDKVKNLLEESQFQLTLDEVKDALSNGDKPGALARLHQISLDALKDPAHEGQIAEHLALSGDIDAAVAMVKQSLERGIQGSADDYANHVAILYKAGLTDDAKKLLQDPQLKASSTPLQLARARNIYVINEADRLRQTENYSSAYNILTLALQNDPSNTDLMLAMARLYQSGKMPAQADQIYTYLLDNALDTFDQEARVSAINLALARGDKTKARELADGLKEIDTPERLLLLARLSEAEGDHQQALANLRRAKGKLLEKRFSYKSTSPMQGGLVLADNPFDSTTQSRLEAASIYGDTMPWQVSPSETQGFSQVRIDRPPEPEEQSTLNQVNQMLKQTSKSTATWVVGGVAIRGRDGESGLSKLTEARAPIQWSFIPIDSARVSINLAAVTLDAGSASDSASSRFGTGALIQGEVSEEEGLSTLDDDELADIDSQGSQSASGLEVSLAIKDDNYSLDLGTTPIGFELNTLTGGASWSPKLTNNLTLTLTGERRVLTESLLAYAGAIDSYSGNHWGQVSRNGLNIQLNFDDGETGFWANTSGWKYLGTNVADNESIEIGTGMYTRVYSTPEQELKVGASMVYKNFSENLSYFSYGQGGYFSPQNHISMSFPVSYRQDLSGFNVLVGGSVGYQSYSLDESAYYPENSTLQEELEEYVDDGYSEEDYYSAESVSGFGYDVYASLEYEIMRHIYLEAKVSYDTFGEYNEFSGQLMLRRYFIE